MGEFTVALHTKKVTNVHISECFCFKKYFNDSLLYTHIYKRKSADVHRSDQASVTQRCPAETAIPAKPLDGSIKSITGD